MVSANDRRIKVVMYAYDLGDGGAERVIANLAWNFDRDRYAVSVVLIADHIDYTLPTDVNLHILSKGTELKPIPALAQLWSAEPPDVVIAHLTRCCIDVVHARRRVRGNFPVIGVQHTVESMSLSSSGLVHQDVYRSIVGGAYSRTNRMIAVSEAVQTDLVDWLGLMPTHITVLYNPVVDLRADDTEELNHDGGRQSGSEVALVLAVGRLEPVKNHAFLIEAFAHLHRERPNTRLVLLGEGGLRGALTDLVGRMGLRHAVRLPGFDPDPWRWYRQADVLAITSHTEAMPNVMIEALSCGVPVIAVESPGGMAEVLPPWALVAADEPATFAAAMGGLLDARPTSADLRKLVTRFDVASATTQYERLIDREIALMASGVLRSDWGT